MSAARLLAVVGMVAVGTPLVLPAQTPRTGLVISSDAQLGAVAESLLPDLARRSGLELKAPVRLEIRSRAQLVRYLRVKLDEQLPPAKARATVQAYALLGLVPADLDLRAVLLALYTEQVAGFYEPDSTALFVMDDQPREAMEGLLVHELVHAVQDQTADLDALTDPDLGNDRANAAKAAIEGQATLVMLEFMTERMTGRPVDLGQIPDFGAQLKPALNAMREQFPALAAAPPVIQESLLFPYLEGAGYVQSLWARGSRVAPFGEYMPTSTEQILTRDATDLPVEIAITVRGGRIVHEDVLGRLELGVLTGQSLGADGSALASGWGGDRYVLVETTRGAGLVWFVVWDDSDSRDRFATGMEKALGRFGGAATMRRLEVSGRPGVEFRIGAVDGVEAQASVQGGV